MSNTRRFEEENGRGIRKMEISRSFVDVIYNEITPEQKINGASIISLTGPDVIAHFEDDKKILGKNIRNNLRVIENNRETIEKINKRVEHFYYRNKINVIYGDIFDFLMNDYIPEYKTDIIYIDGDFCRTFRILCDLGLLENLRKISKSSKFNCDKLYISLTYCQRDPFILDNYTSEQRKIIINDMILSYLGKGFYLKTYAPYSVGSPMMSLLYKRGDNLNLE